MQFFPGAEAGAGTAWKGCGSATLPQNFHLFIQYLSTLYVWSHFADQSGTFPTLFLPQILFMGVISIDWRHHCQNQKL
jgi:hypothetical protein